MENESAADAKLAWETPTVTIVALTSDVRGGVGNDTDEDFFGIPS